MQFGPDCLKRARRRRAPQFQQRGEIVCDWCESRACTRGGQKYHSRSAEERFASGALDVTGKYPRPARQQREESGERLLQFVGDVTCSQSRELQLFNQICQFAVLLFRN